ncbi:MAG TPA: hypothetical protein VHS05_03830 [Pyrinomonadaceae bacterium]|nr:hypothetical protein [Pyrinomonadaceae bacterium]
MNTIKETSSVVRKTGRNIHFLKTSLPSTTRRLVNHCRARRRWSIRVAWAQPNERRANRLALRTVA